MERWSVPWWKRNIMERWSVPWRKRNIMERWSVPWRKRNIMERWSVPWRKRNIMERFTHGGDIYGNTNVELDFSVNTNPFGMPDAVRRALISHVGEYERYPDPQCRALRSSIALHENVPEHMVICGNGAADLIYRVCLAVKPREALVCAPTFTEYERALESVDCNVTHHYIKHENKFILSDDIERQLAPGLDILFLCNPNNPTGRLIPQDTLARILRRAGENRTKVIIDECFLDFSEGVSAQKYLTEMPGLVIIKAFTKIFSIAGLRLGYLLASDAALMKRIEAAAQCWSVSVPAQIAGIAALTCESWIGETRRFVAEEREFLSRRLSELGLTVFPSEVNYLLLRYENPLYAPLLKKGILVRDCGNFAGLDASYIRIGIKTRNQNLRLINAIEEIING